MNFLHDFFFFFNRIVNVYVTIRQNEFYFTNFILIKIMMIRLNGHEVKYHYHNRMIEKTKHNLKK